MFNHLGCNVAQVLSETDDLMLRREPPHEGTCPSSNLESREEPADSGNPDMTNYAT